ncbi:MAG: hypothetical protein V3S60_10430 [Acidimicrobiia bacterium]
MSINTQLTDATTVRRIGNWGTLSRLVLGGVFIIWALWQGVGGDDAIIGLVVFPAGVSLALALRGPNAHPLRLVGPGGYALNILIWAIAFSLAPLPTLLFAGTTQLLAAARGYAGCELFAVSNWLRQRDDQIACPVHSPIDAWEARANGRQHQEVC